MKRCWKDWHLGRSWAYFLWDLSEASVREKTSPTFLQDELMGWWTDSGPFPALYGCPPVVAMLKCRGCRDEHGLPPPALQSVLPRPWHPDGVYEPSDESQNVILMRVQYC